MREVSGDEAHCFFRGDAVPHCAGYQHRRAAGPEGRRHSHPSVAMMINLSCPCAESPFKLLYVTSGRAVT